MAIRCAFTALIVIMSVAVSSCGAVGGLLGYPSTTPSANDHDMMLKAAQCLRDHGLNVKDPEPGEGIQIVAGTKGEANEASRKKADAAVKACQKYMPPPPAGAEEEARENMLAYAKCMRDNGVEKFADPKPGQGIDVGSDVTEDPDFDAADEKCSKLFGGAGRKQENRR